MVRGRYIYDKEKGKMIPYSEYRAPVDTRSKITIIGDEMPETQHPCDGRYYSSKRKFREVTKANGCVEVGGDTEFFRAAYGGHVAPIEPDYASIREEVEKVIKGY